MNLKEYMLWEIDRTKTIYEDTKEKEIAKFKVEFADLLNEEHVNLNEF